MKKNVSIIGCGWLGLPLAQFLIGTGYTIMGSTTSHKKINLLSENGIKAYQIQLSAKGITGNVSDFLSKSEILIVNIPPGLRKQPDKNHASEIALLIDAIEKSTIKKVLYIGSTSVFKDEFSFPIVDASTKPNSEENTAKQLVIIENLFRNNVNFETTVLRFGGLFDDDRHPAKYLSEKQNISNPYAPINLIHKQDCIAIINSILKYNIWNVTLNATYPKHPTKETYYSHYCKQKKIPLPTFNNSEKSKGKIIDSSKLVQLLNYRFKQAP